MEAPGFFLFISTTITLVTAMAITLYVRYSVRRAVHSRLEEESLRLEKHEIEDRLIIARQLATIGALTGGLTYHLNTTLRGVNELAKILRSSVGSNPAVISLSKMISEQLSDAISASNRVCLATYPDRLQLGRASAAEIVSTVVQNLNKPFGVQIKTIVNCQDEHIYVNVQLVRQVVENLLRNAISAMADLGGEILISFSNPVPDENQIGVSLEAKTLQIKITDNGEGMDPDMLEKVFMPQFGKGDGPNAAARLGLPLCFAIMQMLQGEIDISSELGEGTRVSLNFPLALDRKDTESPEIDSPLMSFEDMAPYLRDSFIGEA